MDKEQTKNQSKRIPPRFLEQSKLTAIHFLKLYPDAQIYPFNPKTFSCITGWEEHKGLTIDEIRNNKYKNVLYGLKMSSVPLCVLDFDIKSEVHPEGMHEDTFKAFKKEFGLNNYPCFSVGKSGKGGHFWFLDDNAPQTETNMDFIKGVDYKSQTIMFLSNNPLPFGIKDLRNLPIEFLKLREQLCSPHKKTGRFFKQQRTSYKAFMKGDPINIFESYRVARNEGQTKTQAFSVAGPTLQKLVNKVSNDNFDPDLFIETQVKNVEPKKPIPFYEGILLHNEFNFCYGSQKVGKSRGLFYLINEGLKKFPKMQCGILSTDNDLHYMISAVLKKMKCSDKFVSLNPKLNTEFDSQKLSGREKIEIYLQRIEKLLLDKPHILVLLIDPIPRIADWNNEQNASLLCTGLRDIAKRLKRCIIGVRNEGKNQKYETKDAYKGSSAFGDDPRQINRGLSCHRRSALGKKCGKNKAFIIYSELSSLFGYCGFLFKLEIEDEIAIPRFVEKINYPKDIMKYLSSPESGKTLSNKIFHFIQNTATKGCTMDDIIEKFGEMHPRDTIEKTIYRNFDHKKISGTTYIQLKKSE